MLGSPSFSVIEAKEYLQEKYGFHGQYLNMVLETLVWFQRWHKYPTIRISYRRLRELIDYKYNRSLSPSQISHFIVILIGERLIEKTADGRRDPFQRVANGYEFRPWMRPIDKTQESQKYNSVEFAAQ